MKRIAGYVWFCLLLGALWGCGNQSEKPAGTAADNAGDAATSGAAQTGGTGRKLSIAVIPKGTIHEFWKTVHAGAAKAGREEGVEVIWKGPLREDDRDQQISVVEDFVTRGVSGIVLAPLDKVALKAPVANAMANHIPVVIFDSGLAGEDFVSYVATDNFKGGQMAGEYMAKLLGDQGSVVVLRYAEGSDSTTAREDGFLDAITKHPGIKILSGNQYAGTTTELAYQAGENLIARFKNPDGSLQFQGFFCATEPTTFGMLRALDDAGQNGKVKFVGFDSSAKMIEALQQGKLSGFVVQNPMQIGYMGVKTMVAHLKGEKVEKRVDTGATLVTAENIDTPETQSLLKPDIEQWLKD